MKNTIELESCHSGDTLILVLFSQIVEQQVHSVFHVCYQYEAHT